MPEAAAACCLGAEGLQQRSRSVRPGTDILPSYINVSLHLLGVSFDTHPPAVILAYAFSSLPFLSLRFTLLFPPRAVRVGENPPDSFLGSFVVVAAAQALSAPAIFAEIKARAEQRKIDYYRPEEEKQILWALLSLISVPTRRAIDGAAALRLKCAELCLPRGSVLSLEIWPRGGCFFRRR
ncbi:hypothetical protein HPB48_015392 [Haemaphysalis longicornis]|uniref:Uncharacterized protein n=1 Tax=Haemaphysalis longicornis TaxID=44386 RepID=A0A9J6H4C9_HAELO|nr:hypothetical protein HPB48_015392 [Haemaphysalis longicornis]